MLKGSAIACGLAAVALAASAQAALVTFDLRAVSGGTISADKKTVTNPTGPVVMNLYAVMANTDQNVSNDGFQAVAGSFLGAGTLAGSLAAANTTGFSDAAAASAGVAANLNGDAFQDVGSLATSGGSGWFVASSGGAPVMGQAEFLVGTVTANITALNGGGTVNFVLRDKKDGTVASRNTVNFTSDGVVAARPGSSTDLAVAAPVNIVGVPEPTSMALLGIGALGLLARRRQA